LRFDRSHDLATMGEHRCSISHCPVNVARRGRFLDNWESYRGDVPADVEKGGAALLALSL